MDRKRSKGALVVLDAVKNRFRKTKEFIDDTFTTLQMRYFFASLEAKS